jgi:hypothetical protein
MERILEAIVAVLRDLVAICEELPWVLLDRVLDGAAAVRSESAAHRGKGQVSVDRNVRASS